MLEWVAISYSRGSSQPRDQNCLSCICFIGRSILYHWHHLYVFYPCFHIEMNGQEDMVKGKKLALGHIKRQAQCQGLGSLPKPSSLGQWGKGMGLTSFRKFSYLTMAWSTTTRGGEPSSITMSSLRAFLLSGQEDLSPVSIASTMHCLYLQYLSTLHGLILNPLPLFKTYWDIVLKRASLILSCPIPSGWVVMCIDL